MKACKLKIIRSGKGNILTTLMAKMCCWKINNINFIIGNLIS
jgi:hypothetical protein